LRPEAGRACRAAEMGGEESTIKIDFHFSFTYGSINFTGTDNGRPPERFNDRTQEVPS